MTEAAQPRRQVTVQRAFCRIGPLKKFKGPRNHFRVMENASCSLGCTLRTFCSLALLVSRHVPGLQSTLSCGFLKLPACGGHSRCMLRHHGAREGDVRAGVLAAALCQNALHTVVPPSRDLGKKSDLPPLRAAWPPQLLPSSGGGTRSCWLWCRAFWLCCPLAELKFSPSSLSFVKVGY